VIEAGGDEFARSLSAGRKQAQSQLCLEPPKSDQGLAEMPRKVRREVRKGARTDGNEQFEILAAVEGVGEPAAAGRARYGQRRRMHRNPLEQRAAAARRG